jgi:hypothetical protein
MNSLARLGRRAAAMLGLSVVSLLCEGCATYYVYQGGGHQPGGQWSEPKQLNAWAWGLFRDDASLDDPDVCKLPDGTQVGFDAVKIETNVLASVLTLGVWMPAEVSYRCAQARPPSGPSGD